MNALLIEQHGPHTDLRSREAPDPRLNAGEARIEVHAAAVNPSDIGSAEGRFVYAPLPRILGRDFAGRVIDGPEEWMGAEVWGTGGDLGIKRDGTHAEQLVLPVTSLSRRPNNLTVDESAAAGVPFTTAWAALVDAARVRRDEWVIISGAAGAVGSAAVEIAFSRGAKVIALVLNSTEGERVNRAKVTAIATSESNDLVDVTRDVTDGRGADVALNGVGGSIFLPTLNALGDGGRMIVYSAAGGREVELDLFDLYRRRLQLIGINTGILDTTDGARILDELRPFFERGEIALNQTLERYPLSDAAGAYARVASGTPSKIVLVPDARWQA